MRVAGSLTRALTLSLLVAGTALASDKDCLECHEDEEPVVDAAVLKRSVHKKQSCLKCHVDAEDKDDHDDEDVTLDMVDCVACHKKSAKDYDRSVHAEAAREGDEDAPTCSSCHGEHDIFPSKDPDSKTSHFNIADTCSKCHTDEKLTKDHELPKPDFIRNYRSSVHGRGVDISGLVVSAVCTDCHGNHSILKNDDPRSKVHRQQIPLTCSKCHEGILRTFRESSHGGLWQDGDEDGPICITCHTAHEVEEPTSRKFMAAVARECGECHEDEAPTYKDTFHGQAFSLGYWIAAKCSDCHTPHHNLPADDPRSSIAPENLLKTCRKCHEKATAKFATYDPHPNPKDRSRSPVTSLVFWAMQALWMGTFGFFGLHTLLWLQRSLVGYFRHEFPRPATDGPHVRRFSTSQRATHLTIIITFLGLAATGLPLKFHEAPWARFLGMFLGGVETARYFHRVFGVITFGYAFYHLADGFWRKIKGRRTGEPVGFWAIVPKLSDLKNLFQNLRWMAYLGPAPKLGRWTYWEKFDYFAVFWGIPVIGLSGLALWFPEAVTRLLPGYVLNIAFLLHSEEAFLATGFIFVFHFFHGHLRPENFPMDLTMFTGSMPLERFKRERPLEVEEAERKGTLDRLLCPPPSAALVRVSRIFGFAALIVGTALALGIITSVFFLSRP